MHEISMEKNGDSKRSIHREKERVCVRVEAKER